MTKEVFIAGIARTPIGSFNGSISTLTAPQLGSIAIRSALERSGIKAGLVEEVYFGNVLTAGIGQAPARQAALGAGISNTTPCTTINKVCASGTKSVMLAAQSIMLGHNDIVVAGGMESMSNVPYYIEKARFGYKLGHGTLQDGIIKDGLWDVYNDCHMGNAAESCSREYNISREEQDAYAIESYKRSAEAHQNGRFKNEIVPVEVKSRKGSTIIEDDDEYHNVNFDKVSTLRPVFDKEGTVTAANASTINDGAAALVLLSKEKMEELGLKPIAKILSFADAAQEPINFTTTPAIAIPKAIKRAGLTADNIDFYEINEAFSVVALVNNKLLKLDPKIVNVFGGAVSLGHPIGASGARILITLLSVLQHKNGKIGALGICNGGGGASAMVVEVGSGN